MSSVTIIPTISNKEDKYRSDKNFCQLLIDEFLVDNRKITPAITESDSLNLLTKFETIEKLARLGDVKSVKLLLTNIATDDIFTQDRKNKYISMIDEYISLR